MKALGSFVTSVRRSLSAVVTFNNTYFDIQAWSRMFAVNVQSVSSQQVIWSLIIWYTRTLNVLAAFYVIKVSSINKTLCSTLRDVHLSWVSVTCYQFVSNCQHYSNSVVCHFLLRCKVEWWCIIRKKQMLTVPFLLINWVWQPLPPVMPRIPKGSPWLTW